MKDREWRFKKPPFGEPEFSGEPAPAGREDAKITGVEGLLKAITNIKVAGNDDFVESDAKDLAKYGLESTKPATLQIEIERKAGGPLGSTSDEKVRDTLLIGKKDEKGDKYYARFADDRAVVRSPRRPWTRWPPWPLIRPFCVIVTLSAFARSKLTPSI